MDWKGGGVENRKSEMAIQEMKRVFIEAERVVKMRAADQPKVGPGRGWDIVLWVVKSGLGRWSKSDRIKAADPNIYTADTSGEQLVYDKYVD